MVEILVVMSIIALLLSMAAPRYFDSVDRAKEAALHANLRLLRDSIDKYRGDTGQLPDTLEKLVQARYLREIPIDPVTDSAATWASIPYPGGQMPGVYDVRSGAAGNGRNGSAYSTW